MFAYSICFLLFFLIVLPFGQSYSEFHRTLNEFSKSSPTFIVGSPFFALAGFFSISSTSASLPLYPGIQAAMAFKYAVELVNNNTKLLPGVKLLYEIRNTDLDSKKCLSAGIDIIFSNITMIIGPSTSGLAKLLNDFLLPYQVGIVSYSATFTITEKNLYPNLLRIVPPDQECSLAFLSLLKRFNWTLVTVLSSTDIYGMSGREGFYKAAYKTQVKIACPTTFSKNFMYKDFKARSHYVKNTVECIRSVPNLSVVIFIMNPVMASEILDQMYNLGATGLQFVFSEAFAESFYDPTRIFFGSIPIEYLYGAISISPYIADNREFERAFYGSSPHYSEAQFYKLWEDCIRCYYISPTEPIPKEFESIPLCNAEISSRTLPINCRCIGNESLLGINLSPYTAYVIDAVISVATALDSLIKKSPIGTPLTGRHIIDEMRDMTFQGITGIIDYEGTDPVDRKYSYIQFVNPGKVIRIGEYINGEGSIDFSKLQFYHTSTVPISRIIPITMTVRDTGGATLFVLATILLLVTAIFATLIWWYQDERPIKAASPIFCQLILLGIAITLSTVIFRTLEPSLISCNLRLWSFSTGYSLILTNLILKTYRIYQIFCKRSRPSTELTKFNLLLISGIVLLANITILATISLAGFALEPLIVYSPLRPLVSFSVCSNRQHEVSDFIFYLLFFLLFSFLVFLAVVAFLIRKVQSEFNESAYIVATIYSFMLIFIIICPIYAISQQLPYSEPSKQYAICVCVLLMMSSILLVLFVPKFWALYKLKRKRKSRQFYLQEDEEEHPLDEELANLRSKEDDLVDVLFTDCDSYYDSDTSIISSLGEDGEVKDVFISHNLWQLQER